MKELLLISLLFFSTNLWGQINQQLKNFSEIPKEILQHLDEMGKDEHSILNNHESDYFNSMFQCKDKFDFTEKKIGFINLGVKRTKKDYFTQEQERFTKSSTPINSVLYILNEEQKQETNGYDAVIQYWGKFVLPMEKIVRILNRDSINK